MPLGVEDVVLFFSSKVADLLPENDIHFSVNFAVPLSPKSSPLRLKAMSASPITPSTSLCALCLSSST